MTAQLVEQPPLFTRPEPARSSSRSTVVASMSQAVPHHLIVSPAVSDSAAVLWVVLGTVPRADVEACTFSPGWLAARAGWGIAGEAAARRVRRAVAELVQAGALQVVRVPIGRTGRIRPAYRRLLHAEDGRKWERTTLTEVRGLSPSLWRSLLRWREVMGSQHRTRLPVAVLAVRWCTSPRQLRRQLAALVAAGYLVDAGRHGIQDAIHRPAGKLAPARSARTFLSAGSERESGHFCPPKRDIPSQETHPTVGPEGLAPSPRPLQQPAEAAPRPAEDQGTDELAPIPQARSTADHATRQAWRLIRQTRWLATAPERVRWQARSLLAGPLRRQRFTAADIRIALHRIDPDDTPGQQCRLIRAALAGLRADQLTAHRPPSAPPLADEERTNEPATLPAQARAALVAQLEAAQKRSSARWAAPQRPRRTQDLPGSDRPGDGPFDPQLSAPTPPETLHRLHPQYQPPARSGPTRWEQMTAESRANNHDGDLAISPPTRNDG